MVYSMHAGNSHIGNVTKMVAFGGIYTVQPTSVRKAGQLSHEGLTGF